MRIVLVNTTMETSKFPSIGFITPPYWAAILARIIRTRGHECLLLDLQFQDPVHLRVPRAYSDNVDVVFVSGMIQNYPQMMRVSRFYRERGIKVIFGGWAPTSLYHSRDVLDLKEHIFQFCDAAVIGEAEAAIGPLLDDLERNSLKQGGFYVGNQHDWDWVMPDFTIWTGKYPFGAVQLQRGCPENCMFCSVTSVLGSRVRAKPVAMVRREIELLLATHHFDLIFFYDDNIIGKDGGRYAHEVFSMFRRNFPRVSWFSQCTARLVERPDLMDLFSASRCVLMLVGFESLQKGSLSQVATKFARLSDEEREAKYRQLVAELSRRGIATWGCFIFGFEDDTKETFMRTLKFALESGVMVYQATVITPQPGTPLFSRSLGDLAYPLKPGNWGRYDFMQPVTRHLSRHMSNAEVMRLMHFTIRAFYRKRNILAMVWKSRIPKSFLRLASKAAIRGAFMRLF